MDRDETKLCSQSPSGHRAVDSRLESIKKQICVDDWNPLKANMNMNSVATVWNGDEILPSLFIHWHIPVSVGEW